MTSNSGGVILFFQSEGLSQIFSVSKLKRIGQILIKTSYYILRHKALSGLKG